MKLAIIALFCPIVITPPFYAQSDAPGIFVPSIPYATLCNDLASTGPRRNFTIERDFAIGGGLVPLAGDFNGDGFDTLAIFDTADDRIYILDSNTPDATASVALVPAVLQRPLEPIAGDWDPASAGDEIGFYNHVLDEWYLPLSAGTFTTIVWPPVPTPLRMIPMAGDWDGNGSVTIGLYNQTPGGELSRTFFLATSNTAGAAYNVVRLQNTPIDGLPCSGRWNSGTSSDSVGVLDLETLEIKLGAQINPNEPIQLLQSQSLLFSQESEEFIFGEISPAESPGQPSLGAAPIVGNWDVSGVNVPYEGHAWAEVSPETHFFVGKLNEALSAPETHLHSVVVIRDGELCSETYYNGWRRTLPNNIKSASKSILSALYGIGIERGDLSSGNQKLLRLQNQFPEPYKSNIPSTLSVYHMLTMTAGLRDSSNIAWNDNIHLGPMGATSDFSDYVITEFMGSGSNLNPGEMTYSTGLTHLASFLISAATLTDTRTYGDQHLFGELGTRAVRWDHEPTDNANSPAAGGWEMWMLPRDMAVFGQMILDQGDWNGSNVVPPSWVTESTDAVELRPNVFPYSVGDNYGYWWYTFYYPLSEGGPLAKTLAARGRGGQMILIVPDEKLVVVITSKWSNVANPFSQALDNEDRFVAILSALRPLAE